MEPSSLSRGNPSRGERNPPLQMTHSDICPPSSTWEEKRVQLVKLATSTGGDDPSDKSYNPGLEECDDKWTSWNSDTSKERSHEDSECPSDKSFDPELEDSMMYDVWRTYIIHHVPMAHTPQRELNAI